VKALSVPTLLEQTSVPPVAAEAGPALATDAAPARVNGAPRRATAVTRLVSR
jgi:hypothetical protein